MDAMGVLQHLTGVLVHDGWAPYRHYDQVRHQLCCAHLVRELAAAALNGGQTWANDMAGLLSDAWHLVLATKDSGEQHLDHKELVSIRANYRAIIDAGHEANPPPVPTGRRGRPQRSKAHNLLERLDLHVDDGKMLVLLGPSGCGKTTTIRQQPLRARHPDGEDRSEDLWWIPQLRRCRVLPRLSQLPLERREAGGQPSWGTPATLRW